MRCFNILMVAVAVYIVGAAGAPFVESSAPQTNRLMPRAGGRKGGKGTSQEKDITPYGALSIDPKDPNREAKLQKMLDELVNAHVVPKGEQLFFFEQDPTTGILRVKVKVPKNEKESPTIYRPPNKRRKVSLDQDKAQQKAEKRHNAAVERWKKRIKKHYKQLEEKGKSKYSAKEIRYIRYKLGLEGIDFRGLLPPNSRSIDKWLSSESARKGSARRGGKIFKKISYKTFIENQKEKARKQLEIAEKRKAAAEVLMAEGGSLELTSESGADTSVADSEAELSPLLSSSSSSESESESFTTIIPGRDNQPTLLESPRQGNVPPQGNVPSQDYGAFSKPGPHDSFGNEPYYAARGPESPFGMPPGQYDRYVSYDPQAGSRGTGPYGGPLPATPLQDSSYPGDFYQGNSYQVGSYGRPPPATPLQGSSYPGDSYGGPSPGGFSQDYSTNSWHSGQGGQGGQGPRRHRQRFRRGIQALKDAENTPKASVAAQSASNDIQDYLDLWKITKAKATNIIWPFLTDMLTGTNSTIIVVAALSIYAHLIPTLLDVVGPFFYGLTSLPMLDENATIDNQTRIVNGTNLTLEQSLLYETVIDIYAQYWDIAYNALNQSGYLIDLQVLTDAIGRDNKTLLPFDLADEKKIEYFFISRINREVPPHEWVENSSNNSSNNSSKSPFEEYAELNTLNYIDYLASTSNTSLANATSSARSS